MTNNQFDSSNIYHEKMQIAENRKRKLDYKRKTKKKTSHKSNKKRGVHLVEYSLDEYY